jgi:ribosomal protein S18 acetylase RimI-like enzyme
LATYAAGFGQEADYGCVLVADKTLVGAAWTRLLKGENKGYGYVDDSTPELAMAVKKDYRGRGYGQMLVERISDRLREQGYHQVSLSVDKQNRAARLYQRLGFQIASETQTTYTMIKKLQK